MNLRKLHCQNIHIILKTNVNRFFTVAFFAPTAARKSIRVHCDKTLIWIHFSQCNGQLNCALMLRFFSIVCRASFGIFLSLPLYLSLSLFLLHSLHQMHPFCMLQALMESKFNRLIFWWAIRVALIKLVCLFCSWFCTEYTKTTSS